MHPAKLVIKIDGKEMHFHDKEYPRIFLLPNQHYKELSRIFKKKTMKPTVPISIKNKHT